MFHNNTIQGSIKKSGTLWITDRDSRCELHVANFRVARAAPMEVLDTLKSFVTYLVCNDRLESWLRGR